MAYEQRDNSGALFRNDKEGNSSRPDYKGNAVVNGQRMYISAWIQESRQGQKYMSLKFEAPQGERRQQHTPPVQDHQAPLDDLSDEVPF